MELDRSTIKLLASDTRADVIKSLGSRRKTLTELSKELELSPAALSEQMEKLERGGLVHKVDEGRKWKYYELTRRSRDFSRPQTPVMLVITSLVVVLFAGVFFGSQLTAGTATAPQAVPLGDSNAPQAGGDSSIIAKGLTAGEAACSLAGADANFANDTNTTNSSCGP